MAEEKETINEAGLSGGKLTPELPLEGGKADASPVKKKAVRKKVAKKAARKVARKRPAKKADAPESQADSNADAEQTGEAEFALVADDTPEADSASESDLSETVEKRGESSDTVERSSKSASRRRRGRRKPDSGESAASEQRSESEADANTTVNPEEAPSSTPDGIVAESKPEPEPEPEPEPDPGPPAPELVNLNEFQAKSVPELYELGASLGLRVGGVRSKHQLIYEILAHWGRRGTRVEAEGVLETGAGDNFGFLRWPAYSFMPFQEDIYVGKALIRQHGLQKGHLVRGIAHPPRDREKFITMDEVLTIEGIPVENWQQPKPFDELTAISPRERLILEGGDAISARVVDIIAPLGKGQRGIIVAPPRGGKTIMLKDVAKAITKNHPEAEVIILLLDERPEEVTDFEESVEARVYSSTFDEPPERHIQVAELVAERAKRLVELRRDVVILMDSLTRLARGYNGLTKGGGRTGSGGMDVKALPKSRKIFNIARNVEEGGSLTMLATALIDTGSRMDQVIFEEFKGSGNMEIELDRELLEMRIFPAINIPKSGTRKDDLLYHPDELRRINMIRRQLAARPGGEAMEALVRNIRKTKSNAELLMRGSID